MSRVNISTLRIQIEGSTTGLASSIRNANRQIDNFASQRRGIDGLSGSLRQFEEILARSLALYGVFRAVDLVGAQLFDSVKLAADAELAEISLETLLGSAEDAQRTLSALYDFVERTPFRLTEVRDSAQLLAAFGVETENILPTLRSLGDIAAGINQPIRELADLYGRTLNEQRLYTRDLNQFTSRGIPLIQEFADTFGVAENEVRGLAEAGAITADDVTDALARMTSEGGRFFNLTDRQAETAAGQFSNLLDEVDGLKREFGAGLLPVLTDMVVGFRELIAGADNAASSMATMRSAGEQAGKAFRYVLAVFQGMRLVLVRILRRIVVIGMGLEAIRNLVTGRDIRPVFFEAMQEELQRAELRLQSSIYSLTHMDRELRKVAETGKASGETLADSLNTVPVAVRRAQNALKQMTAQAEKDAEKLTDKFKSPLDAFREAVEQIARARELGGLSDDIARRALRAATERLREASEELRRIQTNPTAIEQGSREDFESRFAMFRSEQPAQRRLDVGQILGVIRNTFQGVRQEVNQTRAAAASGDQAEQQRHEERMRVSQNMLNRLDRIANRPPIVVNEVGAV